MHDSDETKQASQLKSVFNAASVEHGAWVVSDQSGVRQQLLQSLGMHPVTAIFHDLHSKGKYMQLADRLNSTKPSLLWIRLAGPACGSGNRKDDRRAEYLVKLVLAQISLGRAVIVEGNVRSEGWNLRPIRELSQRGLNESLHKWCRYQGQDDDACGASTRIWSNLELISCSECQCRTDRKHFTMKQFADVSKLEAAVLLHIMQDVLSCVRNNACDIQPESKNDAIPPTKLSSLHTSKQDSTSTTVPTLSHANKTLPRTKTGTLSTTNLTLSPTTVSSTSTAKVRFDDSSQLSNNMPVSSFPTEQANRQKERKKAGIVSKKRKQHVEQHNDDVGDNLESIDVELKELIHYQNLQHEEINRSNYEHSVLSHFLSCPPCADDHQYHGLTSSQLGAFVSTYISQHRETIHVCELFGGQAHTSTLCTKLYNLKSGRNFELQCGVDLLTERGRREMWEYINVTKPTIIIMAPPCRGFSPWSFLNEIIHPDAVAEARAQGIPLANLCAAVAKHQLDNNRHFVLEQPRQSTLFQIDSWKKLIPRIHDAVCDQCCFGLVSSSGEMLKKPTRFVASHPILLEHVRNRFCNQRHEHGKVKSEAERWPIKLCRALARGIADLLSSDNAYLADVRAFPTYSCPGCRGHIRKEDPRHVRDETCKFREVPSIEWTCVGCRRHKDRSDPSHTLDENCRWAAARMVLEGAGRPRTGRHPRDPAVPASSEPTSSLRPVDEPHPPDILADAGEPILEDAVREIAEAARPSEEPEVLSPEQAAARRRSKMSAEVQAGRDPDLIPAAGLEADLDREVEAGGGEPLRPPNAEDAEASVPIAESPEWSRFDLGTSLQLLRSVRAGVIRRTLRKLHIRWYHAPAKRMGTLLSAAGVNPEVIKLLPDIVSTCNICRAWSKPGSKSITSTRLPERFNQEVEMDLLFVGTHVVLHMIDRCIRWSVAVKIPDRSTPSLLNGIRDGWINQYGSPNELISDQEGGLNEYAAAILEDLGIKLHLKAKQQHAAVVERHNDLLRRQIHLMDAQAIADGLRVSFEQVLSEATMAKNMLLQYGGYSPYEALYGRTPHLLDVMSAEADAQEDPVRLRSIAVQSMVQAAAEDRIKRAEATRTRPAGELRELQIGDLVEIYRPVLNKDVSRWNGPASVTDLTSLVDGMVGVRWQGRNLQVRVQDCRRALAFVFAPIMFGRGSSPIEVLRRAAESFKGCMRVGWIKHQTTWIACEGNRNFDDILAAGLHVAAVNLQLVGVFSVRFGSRIKSLSGLHCDEALLFWWIPPHFESWNHMFMSGQKSVNLHELGGDEVCFIQFLMEDSIAIAQIRKLNAEIANIGGVHDPRMPIVREVPVVRASNKTKMIRDTDEPSQRQQTVEHYDISTPRNSDNPNADDPAIENDASMDNDDNEVEVEEDNNEDRDATVAWTCAARAPLSPCLVYHSAEVFVIEQDDEPAELEIDEKLSPYLVTRLDLKFLKTNEIVVMQYNAASASQPSSTAVIERTHNVLTRDEAIQNSELCRLAMVKELNRWQKHGAWKRMALKDSHNLLRSKWVLKWKQINGKKDIKGRLVAQGFQDKQSLNTFSGTTSRWGQRLVLAVATQNSWSLMSADVSEAFLRGITFEQLHALDKSQPLRIVEISLPPGTEQLVQSLPGMEGYNPSVECLSLLKPGFGLKDAPRLWNLALHQVLDQGGLKPVQTDKQLFVKHRNERLVLLMSVHVDDLKMTGETAEMESIIKLLTEHFDELKLEKDNFEHLGLRHELHADGSRSVNQEHYVSELAFINEEGCKSRPTELVDETMKSQYLSLLGGVAWVVQTRPDIAIFVSALQRKLQAPCGKDVVNLNRVLAYVKRKPLKFTYHKLRNPWRIFVISDSSFKGEGDDALAMRSGVIALGDRDGPKVGQNGLQVLEFVAKKQSRICRSTFTAELYSALDLCGLASTISLAMTEILSGPRPAHQLADMQEQGQNLLPMDLMIDAKSVYDSVSTPDPKATTDRLMLIHVLKLRELLALKIISRLLWLDTRDMLADGLNKGIVSREALRQMCSSGSWIVNHEFRIFEGNNAGENLSDIPT